MSGTAKCCLPVPHGDLETGPLAIPVLQMRPLKIITVSPWERLITSLDGQVGIGSQVCYVVPELVFSISRTWVASE